MITTAPEPLPWPLAEKVARAALRPGPGVIVGPRVLAGLLAHVDELQSRLDRYEARDIEAARLRAHALRVRLARGSSAER